MNEPIQARRPPEVKPWGCTEPSGQQVFSCRPTRTGSAGWVGGGAGVLGVEGEAGFPCGEWLVTPSLSMPSESRGARNALLSFVRRTSKLLRRLLKLFRGTLNFGQTTTRWLRRVLKLFQTTTSFGQKTQIRLSDNDGVPSSNDELGSWNEKLRSDNAELGSDENGGRLQLLDTWSAFQFLRAAVSSRTSFTAYGIAVGAFVLSNRRNCPD